MTYKILTSLSAIIIMALTVPAMAQESADPAVVEPIAEAEVQSTAPDGNAQTFPRRLELATEMHKLRPAAEQIDAAIASVASQMPKSQSDAFKANIGNLLNYRAIEQISINAMAETFTVEELEAMVEYNSKPEAASIAEKYGAYQAVVSPEIVRMIDRAVMRMRTGATGQ